jgi:hypothetical protein
MTSQITHGAEDPPKTTKDAILETGAGTTQDLKPIKAICAHLNAFHVYASDPSRSMEANHYCTHLSADVRIHIFYKQEKAMKSLEMRIKRYEETKETEYAIIGRTMLDI